MAATVLVVGVIYNTVRGFTNAWTITNYTSWIVFLGARVHPQIDGWDGRYCCSFFTVTAAGLRVGGGGAALWHMRQQAGEASAPMATPNASEAAIAAQKAPAAGKLSALLASWAATPSSAWTAPSASAGLS
eukprot:scaffold121031_cov57-Phaeocystis_antarctica.AAC.2